MRSRGSMSDTRKYRKFSAQQKTELVLASLRGPKTISELCREHDISESLLRKWREQFLAAGAERLSGKAERTETDELRRQVSRRVARSRELVAQGRPAAVVAGGGDQPPGALPAPEATARRPAAPLGRRRPGRPRCRAREPNRRHPDGRRLGRPG